MSISAYIKYWKRGWWAWLLMIIANISIGVALMPIEMIFGDDQIMYFTFALFLWLVIWTPFLGWLFEKFARNSTRIDVSKSVDDPPS